MKKNKFSLIILVLLMVSLGVIGYFFYQNNQLKKANSILETELSQTKSDFASTMDNLETITANLKATLGSTTQELALTKTQRDDFEQKFNDSFAEISALFDQVGSIQGVVGDLEKLRQIDPELLKKYSKVYFLNENYTPSSLFKIPSQYTYLPKSDYFVYTKIWPYLQDMLTAAGNAGIDIKINSAYRSFYDQAQLKTYYLVTYGSGSNSFSADQGYSEHQLGTTLDFSTSIPGGNISDFDKTTTYSWLLNNAYKYGFILSYPKNNQYYVFEPWHWRFVGKALAAKLHDEGKNFYDLDQRDIDAYLIKFFD